jgi:hypothetical protein
MLLHGGTSWFYLLLSYYVLQDAWSIISDANEVLYFVPKLWIYIGCLLLSLGGIGMFVGLFRRPAWRGWPWATILAIAAAGQILYTYLYYDAYKLGTFGITLPDVVDNLSFSIFVCVGYFRAVFDLLLQKTVDAKYHCPRPYCDRRG